ncbi:MAG: carboxypeptidase-like regulatory domain-containing protein, partial [Blastocatellia bacterium]
MRIHHTRLLSLLLSCWLTTVIFAQAPTATISGIVTDTQGGVIPGATVSALNPATGARVTATANEQGFYVLTQLPVTSYNVEAEMNGFRKYVR